MDDIKRISIRYIIFSALCFGLIAINLIIEDITVWIIIDIALLIILTNRVTENYRVGRNFTESIKNHRLFLKELKEGELTYKTTNNKLHEEINFQKISYFFSALFAVGLALVATNMVIQDIMVWYWIDALLLVSFAISIIIRTIIVRRS